MRQTSTHTHTKVHTSAAGKARYGAFTAAQVALVDHPSGRENSDHGEEVAGDLHGGETSAW